VAFPGTNAPAAGGNVTVDFRTAANGGGPLVTIDPLAIGITLSTYKGGGSANINLSTTWKSLLASLAPAHCRIPLRWNSGNPGSSAGGAQTSGDADTYIGNIKAIGAIPFVVYGGDTSDNGGLTGANGAAFVHHYNDAGGQNNGPVKYWVVGNEPDVSGGTGPYLSGLSAILSAMHGADSTVKLSAPAAGFWDTSLISSAAGNALDILSYHAYDGGNTDGTGFPTDPQYYTHVHTDLPGYKAGVMYGMEECNWAPSYTGQTQFYDWHNTCFIADVAGQCISAGGHFTQYSDSNGALSLMNDGSSSQSQPGSFGTTLPAYWGVGIWTGMNNQFKRWGNFMVPATTTFSQGSLTVFACDNGKVVIVNKGSSSQALTIHLGGTTTGTYQVWGTNASSPTSAITQLVASSAYSGSAINYTIPAQTAVSLEVTDSTTPTSLTLLNNFESGSVGATLTQGPTGNTAGTGQNPFDLVTAGSGAVVAFSNTHAAHGSLAASVSTGTTAGTAFMSWVASLNGPLSTVYGRMYLYLPSYPTSTDALVEFHGLSGGFAGGIQVDGTGKIIIQDGAFTTYPVFTSVIPLNTWVRIEFEMVVGAATVGSLAVKYFATLDSATVTETHTDTTGPYGGGGVQQIDFGWTNAHVSQPLIYIDDVGVSTSGYLGPVSSSATLVANNDFEEGTNTTVITTGNSGGTGENAFNQVASTNSATSTFSSTQKAHGSLSAAFTTTAVAGHTYIGWLTATLGSMSTSYGRAYIRLSALPAAQDAVIQIRGTSSSNAGNIQLDTSGHIVAQTPSFATAFTFTNAMAINTWYRVEWKLVAGTAGSASFQISLYTLDSTTATETHTDTTNAWGGTGGVAEINYGWTSDHASQPIMYMDDLAVSSIGFIGPVGATGTNALITGVAAQSIELGGTGSPVANSSIAGTAAAILDSGGVGSATIAVNAFINGVAASFLDAGGVGTATGVNVPDTRTALHLGGSVVTVDKVDATLVGWSMIEVDITLSEFNDETLNLSLTSGGSALNLTSYSLEMYLKPSSGIPDTSSGVVKLSTGTGELTVTNAAGGLMTAAISHANTGSVSAFTFYRVDIVDGTGKRNTAVFGKVSITAL
jgi:hypothetical protein